MFIRLLYITCGNAKILGNDIMSEMSEIRKIMSFFLQFDIIFDDLTLKEHLVLITRFKS